MTVTIKAQVIDLDRITLIDYEEGNFVYIIHLWLLPNPISFLSHQERKAHHLNPGIGTQVQ